MYLILLKSNAMPLHGKLYAFLTYTLCRFDGPVHGAGSLVTDKALSVPTGLEIVSVSETPK